MKERQRERQVSRGLSKVVGDGWQAIGELQQKLEWEPLNMWFCREAREPLCGEH
jgi:hypothetical protein